MMWRSRAIPAIACLLLSVRVTSGHPPGEAAREAAAVSGRNDTGGDSPCLCSSIRLDVSSVERIYLQPEMILQDPERFWQEDAAYQLVGQWHRNISQPIDMDGWRGRIEAIRGLPRTERENHPQLVAARNLAAIEELFVSRAVPHICQFLPPEADLSSTIFFTTEIMAAGFQQSGHIVIHILNHELLNLFVHELFHRGYASIYRGSGNPQPETDPVRLMYLSLHNEGMATYVGHAGISEFPEIGEVGQSPVARDYGLLDDPDEVAKLYSELNQLFREAADLDPEELRGRAWKLGVNERAYYVVGAYMCRLIDRGLGRAALVEMIRQGPAAFVRAYNSVAGEGWRIHELERPPTAGGEGE